MKLFFRELGEGKPLIILHGLFGASDNWLSIGKQLSKNRKVYLLDQRNHGQSPHSSEFTYHSMAEDLASFIQQNHLENPDIVGHSMGGKTTMKYASLYPGGFDNLIIVDIAPKAYPVHHGTIIEGLSAISINDITSRAEADQQLSKHIQEAGVRQFLLKNLMRKPEGGFGWKINLEAIKNNIENVGEGLAEKEITQNPVLFMAGGLSNYIKEEDIPGIKKIFPKAKVQKFENAGHWIHAEQPNQVIGSIQEFLK